MNERPTHLDLFSGIGGFALAAAWAGFRTVAFCEIHSYCQKVIKARFGAIAADADEKKSRRLSIGEGKKESKFGVLHSDIRRLDGRLYQGISLLTAGVPCQPASCAGKRRGRSDDRWLWPHAIRILGEARPAFAVFENPLGILTLESGLVFESLLSQMEDLGYEVAPPIIVPACAVRAGHRRNRVFVVAHLASEGRLPAALTGIRRQEESGRTRNGKSERCNRDAPNPLSPRLEEREKQHARSEQPAAVGSHGIVWPETDFGLLRAVHGVPARLDRNRRARIHALGNSVIPAQVYPVLKAIKTALDTQAAITQDSGS